MDANIIKKIEHITGSNNYSIREEDLHCYSYDGTKKSYLPDIIVFPECTEQVAQLMRLASSENIPVIPRGAGTGMTGGVVPINGGIILNTSKLNRIVEIDQANMIAIVEPGVITADLQREAAKHGLCYPPDPASLKYCTIGGNAGECAGGPSAVKYGVTKDYVMGLEVVLPSGEVIQTGARTEKSVTGYDLTRLFVGSEGTLGVMTRLILRLIPQPQCKETLLIQSRSLEKATEMVATLLNSGIRPCTLEYMDKTAISVVQSMLAKPFPDDIMALLLIEIDGEKEIVRIQTERLKKLFAGKQEFSVQHAQGEEEVKELWKARRSISPATFNLKPDKISEDVAVPRSAIPDLVKYTEKLSRELNLIILTFGHAGDGNIHVNIMLNKESIAEVLAGKKAKKRLFEYAIALKGTLSGEHGIGISKSEFLDIELDKPTIEAMKSIKKLFDPNNIMNPGKIFPVA